MPNPEFICVDGTMVPYAGATIHVSSAAAKYGTNVFEGLCAYAGALRVIIPGLVNTFIAFFKDTSRVAVIGLFDLLGTAKAALVDRKWAGFSVEVYLFVAAVYFGFCFAVSRYSQRLETMLTARAQR